MALKIPLYDQRTVGLRPNPTPQMSPGAAPNLGAAVGHGLAQVSDVFEKAREEADRTAAEEALNKVRGEILAKQQLYQQRTGTQVRDLSDIGGSKEDMLSDHAQRELDAFVANTAKDLNPRVAKLVALKAQPMLQNFGAAIKGHEYEQIKKVQDDTAATAVSQYRDMAVSAVRPDGSVDDAAMKDAIAQGAVVLKEHRMSRGDAEDVINAMTTKFTSESLKGVIGGLLNKGNSTDARRLIKDYEKFFTVEDRQTLGALVKHTNDQMMGLDLATQAMSSAEFVDSKTKTIKKEQAYAWARKQLGDNPDAIKNFMANFDHLSTARKEEWTAQDNAASSSILAARLNGEAPSVSLARVRDLVNKGEITAQHGNTLTDYITDRARQAQAHGRTMQNLEQGNELAMTMAMYTLNPQMLLSLSPTEIMNMKPRIGGTGVDRIAEMQAAAQAHVQKGLQIDNDTWKNILEDGGYTKDGKLVKGKQEDVLRYKVAVEREIEETSKALKRAPTSAEKEQIARRVGANVLVHASGLKGWIGAGMEKVPGFNLAHRFEEMLKAAGVSQDEAPQLVSYMQYRQFTQYQMLALSPAEVKELWNEYKKNTPVGRH